MKTNLKPVRRALLSVSDKTGLVAFAQELRALDIELLSTGGTYRMLQENGIEVTEVSAHTGFPEIMDGRVKTLHPKIHGGILGRRASDADVMQEHDIAPIDLVVVNLYPFRETIAKPGVSLDEAVENIDIGGPTMVRAAAKNHADVTILVNSADYPSVADELKSENGQISYETRFQMAVKAFEHTASYDAAIANHFGMLVPPGTEDFPRTYNIQMNKVQDLRYGENPHQRAAFYREENISEPCIASARQLQGKALSYNNIADTDAALECVKQFTESACVIVKHANPCGVAVAESPLAAYEAAYATDPESAFGGIIALNRCLEAELAKTILDRQFVEVIVAPEVDDQASAALASKPNIRVLVTGKWNGLTTGMDYKRVSGGLLLQDRDLGMISETQLKVVSRLEPNDAQMRDMLFTWKVAKFVKSNAIVYGRNQRTIGVGAGQMSRVNSARIAAIKAEHAKLEVKDSVMASDAFFPFRDGIDNAASVGVSCVIQPGGSVRDEEVIEAADEHGMVMVFTGMRHFRH